MDFLGGLCFFVGGIVLLFLFDIGKYRVRGKLAAFPLVIIVLGIWEMLTAIYYFLASFF